MKASYIEGLALRNVRCFDEQLTDLTDGQGHPARWTLILGDHDTGNSPILLGLAMPIDTQINFSLLSFLRKNRLRLISLSRACCGLAFPYVKRPKCMFRHPGAPPAFQAKHPVSVSSEYRFIAGRSPISILTTSTCRCVICMAPTGR